MPRSLLVVAIACAVVFSALPAARALPADGDAPYQTFTQKLDHFNDSDSRTFPQRYQLLADSFVAGGPLLLLVGPERQLLPFEMYVSTVATRFAKALGGMVLATEHRYYGASLPFNRSVNFPYFTLPEIQYLTINQSLEDNAAIVKYILSSQPGLSPDSKVISFGGSYGGFLSALMRIRFPDLITGSLASCTVPYTFDPTVDPNTWFDTVSDTFLTFDELCYKNVSAAFQALEADYDAGNYQLIFDNLLLCNDTPHNITLKTKLFNYLKVAFFMPQIFNYPTKDVYTFANPLKVLCDAVVQEAQSPYDTLMVFMQSYYNRTHSVIQCFPYESPFSLPTKATLSAYSKDTADSARPDDSHAAGPKGVPMYPSWTFQSLTEFIYGSGYGTGIFQMGNPFLLSHSLRACQAVFSANPSVCNPHPPLLWASQPSRANFSNVIFSRADFDPNRPWSPAMADLSPALQGGAPSVSASGVYAVELSGQAHTVDLMEFRLTPTPQGQETAICQEISIMQSWLEGGEPADYFVADCLSKI